jgi:hypothetical protein
VYVKGLQLLKVIALTVCVRKVTAAEAQQTLDDLCKLHRVDWFNNRYDRVLKVNMSDAAKQYWLVDVCQQKLSPTYLNLHVI